jgi:sugar (pentulose or hexulose) kinase
VVLVDGAGEPLSPLITWQDQRCAEGDFLALLRTRTGQVLHTGYGCATLAWLAEQGTLSKSAACGCTVHDLFVARLCGTPPVTDPTDAASWGLFDLAAMEWDRAAVERAGAPVSLLPPVVACGSRVGTVCESEAAACGLPPGVPVVAALGDNQASLVATLDDPDTDLALTLGTGGQCSAVLPPGPPPEPGPQGEGCEMRPYPGGRWCLVAARLCGGAAWQWLADTVASWMQAMGATPPPRDAIYARLNELGAAAPDTLHVRPAFMGERHTPGLRGSIEDIDLENFDLGTVARAVARGILEGFVDAMPRDVVSVRQRVVGSGNALRLNPLLRELVPEVFGLPLVTTDAREEAAIGAALHAGSGAIAE